MRQRSQIITAATSDGWRGSSAFTIPPDPSAPAGPMGVPRTPPGLSRRGSFDLAMQASDEGTTFEEQHLLFKIQDIHKRLEDLRVSSEQSRDVSHDTSDSNKALRGRLIMASNRLPVSITKKENGEWSFEMSSGGLVTALSGLKKEIPFIWVGWVGMDVPEEERPLLEQRLIAELDLYPVFLDKTLVHKYYNGFCNDVLWPLFHYTPLPMFEAGRDMRFDLSLWDAYLDANMEFTKVLKEAYQPGDVVWVHDYHLMSVPAQLRELIPDCKIGWFLHTPFPSVDIYSILPVRAEIIKGVLMSDMLGFHTHDYARHFLTSASRIMNVEVNGNRVRFNGHFCHIAVFPIGIEPAVFENALEKPSVKKRIAELRSTFAGKKIIIGVDRLDYIKGMPHKLSAFEVFFQRYPHWRRKVVLIQIAVPSRTNVIQYQKLCSEVNEMVGRINGSFGNFDFCPIHYLYQSVNVEELTALYNIADVCMITSVRDGMNLVSHEYVACQKRRCGVLILSEFAGAAHCLGSSLLVNPWDSEEVAEALNRALLMSYPKKKLMQEQLYRYVKTNTAAAWGSKFVSELLRLTGENNSNGVDKVSRDEQ